jgi:hypothetical protein
MYSCLFCFFSASQVVKPFSRTNITPTYCYQITEQHISMSGSWGRLHVEAAHAADVAKAAALDTQENQQVRNVVIDS